ncbi:MAG: hypothetical protein H5T64_00685 [Chloroflexi bacterium]|nr:hypothetical protein [Chloroflexota bacterium]
MRVLVVLGSGGHTKEMIRLVDLLGPGYEYSYLVAANDELSPQKIRIPGPVYKVTRPRWKTANLLVEVARTLLSALQSLVVLLIVRPRAIISSGPGPAVPVSFWGKLLGAKVIFVETGSRVYELSTSGRILYRWADLFFVQWPELQAKYPRAIYAGRLW